MKNLLYAIIISRTRLRANLHSAVPWMSRNSLLEAGANLKWQQRDSKRSYILYFCIKNNTLCPVDLWTKLLWTRINWMSHEKNEKIFRFLTGIILCSIELSFFSILSKNMVHMRLFSQWHLNYEHIKENPSFARILIWT